MEIDVKEHRYEHLHAFTQSSPHGKEKCRKRREGKRKVEVSLLSRMQLMFIQFSFFYIDWRCVVLSLEMYMATKFKSSTKPFAYQFHANVSPTSKIVDKMEIFSVGTTTSLGEGKLLIFNKYIFCLWRILLVEERPGKYMHRLPKAKDHSQFYCLPTLGEEQIESCFTKGIQGEEKRNLIQDSVSTSNQNTHTHTHAHTHTYTHTYIYIYKCVYVCVWMQKKWTEEVGDRHKKTVKEVYAYSRKCINLCVLDNTSKFMSNGSYWYFQGSWFRFTKVQVWHTRW